jgi:hypothetical protein
MAISFKGAHFPPEGVPVVLEQKTTILWKSLYLLASLKDPSGFGVTYETKRSSEEENPVHRQNTTLHVDKIRGFRPLYVWMKTFVFLHRLTIHQRCVVFCTLTTGTPSSSRGRLYLASRKCGYHDPSGGADLHDHGLIGAV